MKHCFNRGVEKLGHCTLRLESLLLTLETTRKKLPNVMMLVGSDTVSKWH